MRLEKFSGIASQTQQKSMPRSISILCVQWLFIPRMDTTRLIEGYQRILRTIYSPSEYYRRALDCLSRLSHEPEPRRNPLISDVTAFVRVALALGVRDHERAEFWHYLKRSITSNRQNFAHAVTLAAMGYHFRKLTEAYH